MTTGQVPSAAMTKTHEEGRRGPLAELAAWAAWAVDGVRGEVTLVVAGVGIAASRMSTASCI